MFFDLAKYFSKSGLLEVSMAPSGDQENGGQVSNRSSLVLSEVKRLTLTMSGTASASSSTFQYVSRMRCAV